MHLDLKSLDYLFTEKYIWQSIRNTSVSPQNKPRKSRSCTALANAQILQISKCLDTIIIT